MSLVRPTRLYTAAQVRELDRRCIEDHGVDGYALMTRAAEAAFRGLRLRWPAARRIAVCCGGGNNGGDGLVIARLARAAGLEVELALKGDPARLRGAAARAWEDWNGPAQALDALDPAAHDVVVDALLGTGLDRPVEGEIAAAIDALNAAATPVLAVDIPSGLDADAGAVLGTAVRAALTVTFIGPKRGLYTGAGIECAGSVLFDDLDTPPAIHDGIGPAVSVCERKDAEALLPARPPTAHKGDAGHVLVVGGGTGFAGAARLAGEAALRAGAGLVSVATRPEHVTALVAGCPALMAHGVEDAAALAPLLERADVVALGPGLGRGEWSTALLRAVLEAAPGRLLVDADGLNGLAAEPRVLAGGALLTPHPGEAARLLGTTSAGIQADRFTAGRELAARYGAAVLLKGPGTLVCRDGEDPGRLLPGARPALAVGGSGDVLTGIAAALCGQGLEPADAACCAGVLLGLAADRAEQAVGTRGLLPTDLLDALGPATAALGHG
ncbi:MAG: NAD(P)H-hydrate dehydratase [Halofilum sp. (in: g-proteobacteria)]|nr:NAD(P)H-hydrate dehydratase [Halofilum sp. (in: g-proteobacteria)]